MRQQFFMMPEEMVSMTISVLVPAGFHVYKADRKTCSPVAPSDYATSFADMWSRHFLKEGAPTVATALPSSPRSFAPAEFGWVQLTAPRILGNAVTMGELSAKWRWYDAALGETKESLEARKSFQHARKLLRRELRFEGVVLVDRRSRESRSIKGIGWSAGALKHSRAGIELVQEGVANSMFEIRSPVP